MLFSRHLKLNYDEFLPKNNKKIMSGIFLLITPQIQN